MSAERKINEAGRRLDLLEQLDLAIHELRIANANGTSMRIGTTAWLRMLTDLRKELRAGRNGRAA